jgi:magnesium and cobalt transporter
MKEDPLPNPPSFWCRWLERLRKTICFHPHNRLELVDILREMETQNLIGPDTLATIEGALQLSELQVRDIMVPRAQMAVVDADATPKAFLPMIIEAGYSRYPVLEEKRDQVIGVLLAKDMLEYLADEDRVFNIKDVLRPPLFVPESKRLNMLLRDFRANRSHMAIVVNEYGGTAGLVSIEDVIEQVVGEIEDEHDVNEEGAIKPHRDGRYIVKAQTTIEEFNDFFHTEFTDDEYDTLGGMLLKAFGHMPARGEQLEYEGFQFKILRADRRRVHLIQVLRLTNTAMLDTLDTGLIS